MHEHGNAGSRRGRVRDFGTDVYLIALAQAEVCLRVETLRARVKVYRDLAAQHAFLARRYEFLAREGEYRPTNGRSLVLQEASSNRGGYEWRSFYEVTRGKVEALVAQSQS